MLNAFGQGYRLSDSESQKEAYKERVLAGAESLHDFRWAVRASSKKISKTHVPILAVVPTLVHEYRCCCPAAVARVHTTAVVALMHTHMHCSSATEMSRTYTIRMLSNYDEIMFTVLL